MTRPWSWLPWLRRSIWVLALPAGLAAESVLLTEHLNTPIYAVYDLAIGFAALYISLAVWESRPRNVVGPLLVGYTAWFVVSPVRLIPHPAWISVSWVINLLSGVWLAHAALAYPSGRLRGRPERGFVAFAYASLATVGAAQLLVTPARDLFGCPESGCPARPPLLQADTALAGALATTETALIVALVAVFAALVARRFIAASNRERLRLWPVAAVVVAASLKDLVENLLPTIVVGPFEANDLIDHAVELGIAVAFFAGFYSSRLERSHIADLLARFAGARADTIEPLLAPVLHDPQLRLGVWDPETGAYIDARGTALLPAEGGDRVMTCISGDDGEPLGALIHDRSVCDDARLLDAVTAATRLALENDRLHARVAAQLDEVRASRARIVQAGDDERRRLERDLHDGAQQRLLAIGMALQLARDQTDSHGSAAELLREAEAELEAALVELRQLARGIHPALLTDQGLVGAVRSTAARTALPVDVAAPDELQVTPLVEKTAYFVVSEALQNVAKHARATRAQVRIVRDGDTVSVEVGDDGVGGAAVGAGTGLAGLRDRVEAAGGTLTVNSLPGNGTVVRAVLPCES
ncbi:MAG TPA: histidine kinase [Candidatus Dormibacteraeota bacterium]